jgi:hypothetical protein
LGVGAVTVPLLLRELSIAEIQSSFVGSHRPSSARPRLNTVTRTAKQSTDPIASVVDVESEPRPTSRFCALLPEPARVALSAVNLELLSVPTHAVLRSFKFKTATQIITLLVLLCFRSSQTRQLQSDVTSENGALRWRAGFVVAAEHDMTCESSKRMSLGPAAARGSRQRRSFPVRAVRQ